MANLKLNDLANADLQNAKSFVQALDNLDNDWVEGDSFKIEAPNKFFKYTSLVNFNSLYALSSAGVPPSTFPSQLSLVKDVPGFTQKYQDAAGFIDRIQPLVSSDLNYNLGTETFNTNTVEMWLWMNGYLNASKDEWTTIYSSVSETYNSIKNNGVLTLFAKVATEVYFNFKYNISWEEDHNILERILTKEVYDDFLKVDALAYINKKPQNNLTTSTEIDITLDIFNNSTGSKSEKRTVTYLDFLAFVQKYPQVFAIGDQRTEVLDVLIANGTILAESFDPNVDPRLAKFSFLSSLPAFSGIKPPENRFLGATHYIKRLTINNQGAKALVRSGYCPAGTAASLESIDIKLDDEYQADQSLFEGEIIEELPPETQVRVVRAGLGKGALFNKIHLFDGAGKLIEKDNQFIDSRVLATFPLTDDQLEESQLVNWLCGLFKNGTLPLIETPEMKNNFFAPDWRERDECQPFLNEKTNEYWITVGVRNASNFSTGLGPEFDISSEDMDALQGGDGQAREMSAHRTAAAVKGLHSLLSYYGKVNNSKVVNKILQFNKLSAQIVGSDGSNATNPENSPVGKTYDGLFLTTDEYFSDNRNDDKTKILVKVNRNYFDADWLKQAPRPYNTVSLEEYAKLAPDNILPLLEIRTDRIENKIKTLLQNIDKEFKPRIKKYIDETGDKTSFKDLDKKKKRIESFVLFIKRLMKINGLQYDNSKNDKLLFGFTKELELLFVAYAPESSTESDNPYYYLSAGVTCAKFIPSKEDSIIADQTSLGYLLYADRIAKLIMSKPYSSELEKNYAGIKLVQKFTIPSPTLSPSKKQDPKATKALKKVNDDGREKFDQELKVKTRDQVTEENTRMTDELQTVKAETVDSSYKAGDDVTLVAPSIVEGAQTAEDMYTFLQLISIREFIIKATVCLKNSIDPDSAIDAATIGVLNAMSPLNLIKMLGNGYFLNELSNRIDPETFSQIQSSVNIARETGKIALNVTNMIKIIEKHPTASQDFLNATKETARYYNEDYEGAISDVEGATEITESGTALDGASALESARTLGADGLPSKKIDTPRLEVPAISYKDDPMEEVDASINKGIDNSLNTTVLAAIKTTLEAAVFVCEEINQQIQQIDSSIASQLNTNLINSNDSNANSNQISDLIASINDEEISLATSQSIMNLANLPAAFEGATDPSQLNQAGNLDVQSLLIDADNIDDDIKEMFENSNSQYPTTSDLIEELKQLLDYVSGLLRPSEICSLFSYNANPKTLSLVLDSVQEIDEYSILKLFIKSTDDVASYFAKLGNFMDTAYCSTIVKDLSLITILCEKEIKDQAYRELLKSKGFSDEQCNEILSSNEKLNKEKLQKLEEILAYDEIADYFQSAFDDDYDACSAGALINNDYMNTMVDEFLESLFSTVSDRFNMDVLGAKAVLIQEEFVQGESDLIRYPVLGRDYNEMFNGEDPIFGAEGTSLEGVELFDDRGLPRTENFPLQDKVIQTVAPRLKVNLQTDQSNILARGNVNVDDESSKYKKFYSNVEMKSAGTTESYEDLLIDQSQINEVVDRIEELNEEIDNLGSDSSDYQNLVSDRDQALQYVEMSNAQNQIVQQQIVSETLGLTTLIKTENVRLVDYQIPRQSEIKNSNRPLDYSRFYIVKNGKFSFDGQENGLSTRKKLEINDLIKNNSTYDLLLKIYQDAQNEFGNQKGITYENKSSATLPEFAFAKTIVKSLEKHFPSSGDEYDENYLNLEKNVLDVHQVLMAEKQREIFDQCRRSRLFNIEEMSSLILGSQSEYMSNMLQCSDSTNPNLKKLKEGMLDLGGLETLIKDYYKKIACETFTRPPDDPGPFNEAVQFGMALLLIRLTLSQVIIRAIFFFSRFSVQESLVDSGVFLTLIFDKVKEAADLLDPELYNKIKEIAMTILKKKIDSNIQISLLSNTIFYDNSSNLTKRRFTNFEHKMFNLADLEEVKKDLNSINIDMLEIITNNIGLDAETNSVFEVRALLNQKFVDLSLKDMINDNTKTMTSLIDNLLLDKEKRYSRTKNLLASDILYDVPNQMLSLDNIKNGDQENPEGSSFIISEQQAMDLYEQEYNLAQGTVAAAKKTNSEEYGDLNVIIGFDHYYEDLIKNSSKSKSIINTFYSFPAKLYSYDADSEYPHISLVAETSDPTFNGSDRPVVLNINQENVKLLETVNAKNICVDSYNSIYSSPNALVNSSFYDKNGNFTNLGDATKNGGFVLQKYIKIKFDYSKQYFSSDEAKLHAHMLEAFQRGIGLENAQLIDSSSEITISYKNFDVGLYEALKAFSKFDESPIADATSDLTYDDDVLEFDSSDTGPTFDTPGFSPPVNGALNKLEMKLDNVSISYLFSSIKHGVRLVYVAPHDIDILDGQQNFVNAYTEMDSSNTVLKPSRDTSNYAVGTYKKLLKSSIEFAQDEKFDFSFRDKIFNHKAYQIKELIKYGEEYSSFYLPQSTGIDARPEDFRMVKSFYVIPIEDAFIDKNMSSLGKLKFEDIKNTFEFDLDNLNDTNSINYQKIANKKSLVQDFGINAASLVDELFSLPSVDLFDSFVFPTSSLLDFAILHHMHFPYDDNYNYDKMFLESRKIIADILKSTSQNRNNWEKTPEPQGPEGQMETFNEAMDKALSFGDRDNAFLVWCAQLVPKLILRYIVKQVDPGMKYFMNIQEAEGLPDSDLLKMILNPFGVRPTPIWPPGFPVFGNPAFNLTPMGLLYTVLAPLPIGVPQFNDVEEQEQQLPQNNFDTPTIGNPFGAGNLSSDPIEECKI
jgi:hypothetical protein